MIRKAVAADIPELVRGAGDFLAASNTGVPFNADYLASSFRATIAAPDRLVLVLDIDGPRGALCGVAIRSIWGPQVVASELAFWIDPPYRGRWALKMLRAYVDWARDLGCDQASMVALANNPLDRLYEKAGFQLSEMTYSRVL